LDAAVVDARRRARIIVMVSRFDHALLHLLYQVRVGWLDADIVAIVSNHPDARSAAEHAGIPFHHWPVTPATKAEVEARLLALVADSEAELVVLARYMQVLSADLTDRLAGRVTSTTPSFRVLREPSPIISLAG
jgi:formyltetrahydrofolate deformylase